jgi:lipopolysaccharide/colanic/teichoic acid biosynthesis glycosyltransferase
MDTGSKIPLQQVAIGSEFVQSHTTIHRPLRMLAGSALATLIGFIFAGGLVTFLQHALATFQGDSSIPTTNPPTIIFSLFGIAAIAAMSQARVHSRLLLTSNISFLWHYIWFSFAANMHQDITISEISMSFFAVIACSLVIELLSKLARPERVGAIAYGISRKHLDRLSRDVDLVTDPSAASPQHYDVLLVDFITSLPPEWSRFVSAAALMGCEVRHVTSHVIQQTASLWPEDVEHDLIVHRRLSRSNYIPVKRFMDIVIIILIAPAVVLLGALAAVAILVSMGRPVIFTQDRVGKGGKIFRMYKFRTMHVQNTGGKQSATAKGDLRVTPLGRILRRCRIDELPQLVNVLKGEMSLIGPRPEQPQLVAGYKQVIPHYDLRHEVQPGLSGWAQINFGYASTTEETQAKTTYDLYYISELSFALDMEIAIGTIWVLLTGRNAR